MGKSVWVYSMGILNREFKWGKLNVNFSKRGFVWGFTAVFKKEIFKGVLWGT